MRPFCVGLTGGIGSGKSTVAEMFAACGAAIVDTDEISHALTRAGGAAMAPIAAAFGVEALDAAGGLDRARMRGIVFGDPVARRRLEHILHPMIRAEAEQQIGAANSPYVVLVVPLLAENLNDYRGMVDRVAVVDCEPTQQLARTASRPGMGEDQALAILAAQSGAAARLAVADDVIDNRDGLPSLRARVAELHRQYLAEAQIKSPA